ncbi:MAG: hypothetical protein JST83_02765 [Bacteroidetes bacterium]|nr:hypothetical protein [Bacteroidota bacterium]
MKENQKRFLAQFDQPLRKHIINFCNSISSTNYDVYILLARKAACFIDTLIELDLIEIRGSIVSDRVLEYDTCWLSSKTIAIVDDTIISGTSIYKLINKLEQQNVQSIDVFTFCINEYWYVEEMLLRKDGTTYLKQPYLKLDHSSSLKFCKNIVEALSITPRPYNIDFPIYEKIKLSYSKISLLFESQHWRVIETTSTKQKENNVLCFTINPTKKFLEEFTSKLGWDISKVAHFKLRLYCKKIEDPTYLAKVVPFIIFNPITDENVAKIISRICENEGIQSDKIFSQLKTEISKLLFIQFYYAEKLFHTWVDCTDPSIKISSKYIKNERSLYFLFTPEVLEIINKMHIKDTIVSADESDLFLSDQIRFDQDTEEFNPLENLYNLTKPFLNLYYEKELPARRIVKKINKKAFTDIGYIDVVNRLEDGISVNELKLSISKIVNNQSDINQILSLFLDQYIDNGVIVPITVSKNGYLYRGYRHGEEVIWGNYNNRLLGKFFQKYLQNIKSNELGQTYFQKLLVLFLKLGLKEGVLEEYSNLTPRQLKTKLVSIKAHLFGLITDYTELPANATKVNLPIIDPNTKSYWTSKLLQDLDVLSLNKKKNFEFNFDKFDIPYSKEMEINEPSDIDPFDLDKVYDIADIFGFLRSNKKINEEDLVLLTSCVNLHDNTASLAAELQIYLNSLQRYKHKISSGLKSGYSIEKLKSLRDLNENFIWTAANSGYFKYLNYSKGNGLKFIHEIETYLEQVNKHSEARIWRRYWKIDVELSQNEINELNLTNQRMGQLLLEVNIAFAITHLLIYEIIARQKGLDTHLNNLKSKIENSSNLLQEVNKKIKQIGQPDINTSDIETVMLQAMEREKKDLQHQINNNSAELKYWKQYDDSNINYLNEVHILLLEQKLPFKNALNFSKIVNKYYKHLSDADIVSLINDNIQFFDELYEDISVIMQDYKLTVPEWGKIQQKVKYNSFIHINSTEIDIRKRESISKVLRHYLSEFELEEFGNESEYKTITLLRVSNAQIGHGQIIGVRGQFTVERLIKLSCKLLKAFNDIGTEISISVYPDFKENGVDTYYNNQSKNFDIIRENLYDELETNNQSNTIVIYDVRNKYKLSDFLHYKLLFFQNQFIINEGTSEISKFNNYTIKIPMDMESKPIKGIIGVVTALPKEFAAMRKVLDDEIPFAEKPDNDNNDYAIGLINNLDGKQTKVVIALMKEMGTNNAASTATNLLRSFPEINEIIVCGIAGGVPDVTKIEDHVRLGDIVVSNKDGILQYDNIKETNDEIKIRSSSAKPSAKLLGIVNLLIADFESNDFPWMKHIKSNEGKLRNSSRPQADTDILKIKGVKTEHPVDPNRIAGEPKIFHGPIGSSNNLLKNEIKRDYLRDKYGVKAIEMEGSGIADGAWNLSKEYLVVRGIVDYCNTDKNDDWHNYAAICAACYTKTIIEKM